MPSLDHRVAMALKLDPWGQAPTLRAFEIEREIMDARHCGVARQKRKTKRFSLGNLKMLWGSTA